MARIIVAEDDDIVAEVVRDALVDAGHAVGVLPTGAQALAVIRARMPELVILDCNMPELSGLLVLREMRLSPALADIPVLILTGRRSEQDETLAMFEGANGYMKKPFEPANLVHRVERLLEAHRRAA